MPVSLHGSSQSTSINKMAASSQPTVSDLPEFDIKPANISRLSFDDLVYTKNLMKTCRKKYSLKDKSREEQEKCILEDLCFILIGIEGKYLSHYPMKNSELQFYIDPYLDQTLNDYVAQFLVFAENANTISKYIDDNLLSRTASVFGCFTHCVQIYLGEYYKFVADCSKKINHSDFTLRMFLVELEENFGYFKSLAEIIKEIIKSKYSAKFLIDTLYSHMLYQLGSGKNLSKIQHIFEEVINNFLHYVTLWMSSGELPEDQQVEIFISKSKKMERNQFSENFYESHWNDYFELNEKLVPNFLQQSSELIFKTGKFAYAMNKFCKVKSQPKFELKYSFLGQDIFKQVHELHLELSKNFLNLFLKDLQFKAHFESLKNIYLLGKADFINIFIKNSREELEKISDEIIFAKLESSLDLATEFSTAKFDPNMNNFSVELEVDNIFSTCLKILDASGKKSNESQSLNYGLELVCFNYKVNWPLSILLNQKALFKYKIFFRFLLKWRLLTNDLQKLVSEKKLKKQRYDFISHVYNIVQNLYDYFQLDVIDAHSQTFLNSIDQIISIEELQQKLDEFLQKIGQNLFIDSAHILSNLSAFISSIENIVENDEDARGELLEEQFAVTLSELAKSIQKENMKSETKKILNRLNCF